MTKFLQFCKSDNIECWTYEFAILMCILFLFFFLHNGHLKKKWQDNLFPGICYLGTVLPCSQNNGTVIISVPEMHSLVIFIYGFVIAAPKPPKLLAVVVVVRANQY